MGTNISCEKSILKVIFLFPRWDMLISWRVCVYLRRAWCFFVCGVLFAEWVRLIVAILDLIQFD